MKSWQGLATSLAPLAEWAVSPPLTDVGSSVMLLLLSVVVRWERGKSLWCRKLLLLHCFRWIEIETKHTPFSYFSTLNMASNTCCYDTCRVESVLGLSKGVILVWEVGQETHNKGSGGSSVGLGNVDKIIVIFLTQYLHSYCNNIVGMTHSQ